MAEKTELGSIRVVTDCDTGIYTIGEVDGGWKTSMLKSHISKYGVESLLIRLAHMQSEAITIARDIKQQEELLRFTEVINSEFLTNLQLLMNLQWNN